MSSTEPTAGTEPVVRTGPPVRPDVATGHDPDLRGSAPVASLPMRVGAEALGAFALVLVTVGVALYGQFSGVGGLGVAVAAGLVLVGTFAAFGGISGGHFNPAVTLGAAIAGRTSWVDLPLYWLAQLVGGVAAVAAVFLSIPGTLATAVGMADVRAFVSTAANGWDEHSPLSRLSSGQVTFDLKAALVVELIAAAVLVSVYLGVTHRRGSRGAAPAAIGLTYAALLLLLAPITGGGLNPARSTATALFAEASALGQVWLFWAAPLVGAAIVGLVHLAVATPSPDDDAYPGPDDEPAEGWHDDDASHVTNGHGDHDDHDETVTVEPR